MEDRLKNLKKAMDRQAFSQLKFTEKHRRNILGKINQPPETDEDILVAVMQLLVHEKTGFELTKLLRGRGIKKFEDNEGFLYTLLHRLEQSGCIQSCWTEAKAKYYQLTDKGRKVLRKADKKQIKSQVAWKELFER
ncbi:lineage-specific thermal regulator protein [Bacillus sp. AFS073361]|uniref:PadR family transcriptional regulator n=1 Tax=Bacillaceae TaxID=186817 RepID=UPI000BF9358F|nr:PadR family transcriptional regulator [Bacillus sp. AFS073361]PFP24706.1 lineage-specific thermal regulator protein [Bacillus sp. AFS073361]